MNRAFNIHAIDDLRFIDGCTTRRPGDAEEWEAKRQEAIKRGETPGVGVVYTTVAESTLFVSGDALLTRSALFATGLVGAFRIPRGEYCIYTTRQGQSFVRALDAGDMTAIERLLGMTAAKLTTKKV